jgi:hypothetical protein
MSVKGTLRGSELVLGRLTVDWLTQPSLTITALAAIVDSTTGATHAWLDGRQVAWSSHTAKALEALRKSVESDMAAVHLIGGGATGPVDERGLEASEGGLSEHLGTASDNSDEGGTPSI